MTPSWTPPDAEIVTLAEAAVRLGISPDAARKRLERGTLRGEKRGGRWRVALEPDARTDTRSDATDDATPDADRTPADAVPDTLPAAARELIDALQAEVTYLRQTLDTEIEARRRADHLVAGLMERLPELPRAVESAPQDAIPVPPRDDLAARTYDPYKPSGDTLALSWRRWWRRITGGA